MAERIQAQKLLATAQRRPETEIWPGPHRRVVEHYGRQHFRESRGQISRSWSYPILTSLTVVMFLEGCGAVDADLMVRYTNE